MHLVHQLFDNLLADDRAASSVEYGLLLVGVASLIVAIVFSMGTVLKSSFHTMCTSFNNAMGGPAVCNS